MRRRAGALLAGLVGLGILSPAVPAGAATTLELTRQTPWVLIGGIVELDLEIVDPPPDTRLSVVVHDAITARSDFDRTLEGDGLEELGTVDEISVPLWLLPEIGSDRFRLSLQLENPLLPEPAQIPIRQPGVYPMEVGFGPDADAPSFVTHLVVVGGDGTGPEIGERLGVSWIWPLEATPALGPDGGLSEESLEELGVGGRVGRQAVALADADVPVTVAPGPFTTEQWLEQAVPTETALRRALGAPNQVVPGGYVPVDLPSLLAAGLDDAAGAELVEGTATLEDALDARVDTRTALALPIDRTSFARLTDANVDRVVVDPADLETASFERTPARPFVLSDGGRSVRAAAVDHGLEDLVAGNGAPALRAQQLLAALALIASETPNRTRGVVVVNPADWDPEPTFLAAALAGLRGHPMLRPMTLDRFFEAIPLETDDAAERALAPRVANATPVDIDEYRRAEARQASFRAFAGADSPRTLPGERALLVALSSIWGPDSSAARRELDLVEASIDRFLAEIRIPVGSSITLTARTGSIPLTFVNETGEQVTVRVSLDSDKLDFPEGAVRDVVLAPRATTESFEVETRTSGRFPLVMTVSSPDGEIVVSTAQVDVRSTAVSGVGLFLAAGAGIVLAGWWVNDIRKRRKARQAPITRP